MDSQKPVISPRAKSDIDDIWFYIARDSIKHADEVIDDLEEDIHSLSVRPAMGRKRTEFSDE
jgi:plasmid stabilization system protein ParE